MAKYSVNDSVWIAAAIMAYEKYHEDPEHISKMDMYFKQSKIVKCAQNFTDNNVDNARVSWWVNADNEKHTQNYLRADLKSEPSLRRLSMMDEFAEKSYPESLDPNDDLSVDGKTYQMGDILQFVREVYPSVMQEIMTGLEINYIGVLDYLKNNQEIPYSNPNAPGIASEKKKELLEIKQRGQNAVVEMKKMASRCSELYGLDKCMPGSWLDGSNTKTRKYLWTQMKYKAYEDNPISVSLFVEKNEETTRYRISLEIKNNGTDKQTMAKYHSYLNLPAAPEMVFVAGSNEWGNPAVIEDTQESIKEKVESEELRKVQLCIYIEPTPGKTNQQYDAEIMAAVKKLIPFYEYVIGVDKVEYWPSLEKYNPGITKDQWAKMLADKDMTTMEDLKFFKCWLLEGGESTCANAAVKFGGTPAMYNMRGSNYADKVKTALDIEPCDDDGKLRTFPIVFLGRNVVESGKERYSWRLRDELKEALEDMDLSDIDVHSNETDTREFDKNMILYGPPGTGKTYSTAKYAVAICDGAMAPDLNDYTAVMKRYRELMNEHRISFVTFHQSYGYEEFIEGIKPVMEKNTEQASDDEKSGDVKYDVVDGIFKTFCEKARKSTVKTSSYSDLISDKASIWKATVRNDVRQDCFDNNRIRIDWEFDSDGASGFVEDIQKGDIIITTDGSRSRINGIAVVTKDEADDLEAENDSTSREVVWLATDIDENIKSLNKDKILHRRTVARVPNMTVADIVALAKKLNPENAVLSQTTIEENKKAYVFVIDEINRGNISKIFGELITLIEDTKREGLEECIPATLPYSGDEFMVPDNVYILGTMNTADRSIALMDTALRRRFSFKEMLPDHTLLQAVTVESDGISVDVELMLKTINDRITYLYDREHTIGHAIFMGLKKDNSIEKLASIFAKTVIPLLQEYFYEDYEKIRLVLGDNAKKDKTAQFIVADDIPDDTFEGDSSDEIDIPEKSYTIAYDNFEKIMAYKGISKKL